MANPFDQFDETVGNNSVASNPFDQFDEQPKSFVQDVGQSKTLGEGISKVQERVFKDYIPRAYESVKGMLPENTQKVVGAVESIIPDTATEMASEAIQAIPRGLYNTGAETIRTIGMLNPFGGKNDAYDPATRLGNFMGEFNDPTPTATGEFVETATRLAPAIAGGMGLAGAIPATTRTASVVKGLVGMIGADVASSLFTLDPDTQTLFVGEDAAFLKLPGWGVREDGSVNPNVFSQKLNLLADALLISGVTGATTATAGKLLKKIWQSAPQKTIEGIMDFASKERTEEKTLLPVIQILGDIDPNDTPDIVQQKMAKVIQILKENKETAVDWSAVDPSLGAKKTKKDTVSLMTEELTRRDPEMYADQITDLNDLRKAAAGSATESRIQAPVRQFEQSMDEATAAFGGTKNIDEQGKQIIKGLDDNLVKPFQESLGEARAKQTDIAQALYQEMNTNPQLVDVIGKLDKKVKLNLSDKSLEAGVKLVDDLTKLGSDMTATKNQLYQKIGEAAGENNVVGSKKLIEDTYNKLSTTAKNYLTKKGILNQIDESGLNVLRLEEIANFDINDVVQTLKGQQRYNLAKEMLEFKKALTIGQLDYLSKAKQKGNAAVVKAAKNAYNYYTKEFLPWRENPILEEIMNLSRNTPDAITSLDKNLTRPSRELGAAINTNNLLDFTQKNLGQDFNEAVADFTLLRWAEDLQGLVNTGKIIDPEDVASIQKNLTDWGPVLQKASPEKYQALTDTLTRFRDGAFDLKTLDKTVADLTTKVESQKRFMYDTLLKNFNTVNGEIPNSYQSFTKLLTTEGNEEAVRRILDVAKQNPELEKGMKAIYTSVLKDYVFDTGGRRSSSGARKFNLNNITNFLDQNSSINKYSRQILGDGATTVFEESLRVIYNTGSLVGGKGQMPVATNAIARAGGAAVNRVMTLLFGVLNPVAARVRTMTGQLVESASTTPYVSDFLDKALANSDVILEVAERMQKKGVQQLTPADKEMLLKLFNRSTIYTATGKNENNQTVDEQTQEVFQTPN